MFTASDSFTEHLRQTYSDRWDAATRNRFIDELVNDTIDAEVYAQYLNLDYAFIDLLVSTLATRWPSRRECRRKFGSQVFWRC